MKYTTLLFDADDTLYDFRKAEETALKRFFERLELLCPYEIFREVYRVENEKLWEAFERREATAEQVKVNRFVNTLVSLGAYQGNGDELSRDYMEELARCRFLLPGADRLCKNLSACFDLYIITNGLWDVQRSRIGDSEIYRQYFKGMVVSEKVGSAKPDRKIFEEVWSLAGNPPLEKILIIGDSLSSDIRGGAQFGIDTCWFNPRAKELNNSPQPTYEVKNYGELEEILF